MILSPLSLFNFISFVTFILFPLPLETLLVLQYKSNQYFYHYFFLLFLSSFSPFRYFLHALFCHFVIISILKTLVSSPFISQSKIYSLLKLWNKSIAALYQCIITIRIITFVIFWTLSTSVSYDQREKWQSRFPLQLLSYIYN